MMLKRFLALTLTIAMLMLGSTFAAAQDKDAKPEATTQESTAKPSEEVKKIDLNAATQAELETLPDIGPKLAQAIIEGRPYVVVEDVLKVKGIGEKKFAAIKPLIEVKPPEQSASEENKPETEPAKDAKK